MLIRMILSVLVLVVVSGCGGFPLEYPPLEYPPVEQTPRRVERAKIPKDVFYGRRLEPGPGKVLHGAGQDEAGFAAYWRMMPADKRPAVMMLYSGVGPKLTDRLPEIVEPYGDAVAVQIGMGFVPSRKNNQPQKIVDGEYDDRIEAMCLSLKAYGKPVFLRLGYEFNGEWNKYDPALFRKAWRRIATAVRKHELENVALVWCYAVEGMDQDYMSWYPGDDYVDWWSIDVFSVEHLEAGGTKKFLQHAHERGYPVMIGESTARWVGVKDGRWSWDAWFARYFKLMKRYPNIKSFCFIQWDWSQHYPETWHLHYWGENRVWMNAVVWAKWLEEMGKEKYQHAAAR